MINTFDWVYSIHKRILFISVFAALLSISLINSPCAAQVLVKSSDWIDAELFPIMVKSEIAVNKNFGSTKMVLKKNGVVENYDIKGIKTYRHGIYRISSKWIATETGNLTITEIWNAEFDDTLAMITRTMELKLQGISECSGTEKSKSVATKNNEKYVYEYAADWRFRIVFAKKEPVNPNVVGNKPMPPSAHNESLINKSATDVINQALSDSKGNISGAEAIVQKMRRASQEASDNPALIRAQYWLKGRNGATIFGESTAYFLGSAYLSAKKWGIGFDKFTAWSEGLSWNPAPYDPATREWYNNGVQNILLAK